MTRHVDAPPDRVWALLADTRHWPDWGPSVRAVDPSAALVEPGLTGRVRTAPGPWVPFEVTAVVPGRSWDWRVAGIPATGHTVTATGDGCTVGITVPAWAPFYAPVCALALRRIEALATRPAGR